MHRLSFRWLCENNETSQNLESSLKNEMGEREKRASVIMRYLSGDSYFYQVGDYSLKFNSTFVNFLYSKEIIYFIDKNSTFLMLQDIFNINITNGVSNYGCAR